MTPVFRHGRLRLYLLKLLDETPRHGYEVIRLLQDRFLGVYSPSPGTIYPRLARLEEEGLVTHDEVGGKKVYRITAKGQQELRARMNDLRELEDELTASARGIAMEIGRDVRETVRSLREEIGRAARSGRPDRNRHAWDEAADSPHRSGEEWCGPEEDTPAERIGAGRRRGRGGPWSGAWDEQWADPKRKSRDPVTGLARPGPPRFSGDDTSAGPWVDLERLATDFAREVQSAATRAKSGLDEGGISDVRGILADALTRIRTEVFGAKQRPPGSEQAADARPAQGEPPTA